MNERKSKAELERLMKQLNEREFNILRTLRRYHYLSTHHIRRLYFNHCVSELAALRSANRVLAKLRGNGLIVHLSRRIGGVRAGSGAFIWTLSPVGARLLALVERDESPVRRRSYEPSTAFLEHMLAVAETAVLLHEMAMAGKLDLVRLSNEPDCWRYYSGAGGAAKILKPDLLATTASGEYEDSWFLELDLASESPSIVLKKCAQYLAYYQTGAEQRDQGVFPCVAWVVPDEKRRESISRHMARGLSAEASHLFVVILMGELESLLLKGAENFKRERRTGT